MMSDRIENINDRGASLRRRNGILASAIAVLAFGVLLATGAPRWSRLLLALPIGLAAISFLQARARTCVVLCAIGQREPTDDRSDRRSTAAEMDVLRPRARSMVVRATLIAASVTALLVAV